MDNHPEESQNNLDQMLIAYGAYCPLPLTHDEQIVIGHGSGGRMTHDLVKKIFQSQFKNSILMQGDDGAVIHYPDHSEFDIVVSVDSHVVTPIFFPGGDIGKLSISGTVNDVAVMGATPKYITTGFIIEEGLHIDILYEIVKSMKITADEADIQIIAGDTKVVEKGKVDKLFITTTGVGFRKKHHQISGSQVKPGDDIILSGSIGEHGMAVLQARGELGLESNIKSDVAPLNKMIMEVLEIGEIPPAHNAIHAMRDPTRGGLATTLNEIAVQSSLGILIEEEKIPISPTVTAMCDILGFDPLYVANEGKCVFFVDPQKTLHILDALRSHKYGKDAVVIGRTIPSPQGKVLMKTSIGSTRILDMLSGEMLPRIC